MDAQPVNDPEEDDVSEPAEAPEAEQVDVTGIGEHLELLTKFVARRFDELSMEINATSQQVDMAEEGLTKRFRDIFDVIEAITHTGDGSTAANSGVELDAAVKKTEEAAVRILDAVSRITIRLKNDEGLDDKDLRAEMIEAIKKDVEEIYLACEFQDLTSQRIRTALDNMRLIEENLSEAVSNLGINIGDHENEFLKNQGTSSQDDIDDLFD